MLTSGRNVRTKVAKILYFHFTREQYGYSNIHWLNFFLKWTLRRCLTRKTILQFSGEQWVSVFTIVIKASYVWNLIKSHRLDFFFGLNVTAAGCLSSSEGIAFPAYKTAVTAVRQLTQCQSYTPKEMDKFLAQPCTRSASLPRSVLTKPLDTQGQLVPAP